MDYINSVFSTSKSQKNISEIGDGSTHPLPQSAGPKAQDTVIENLYNAGKETAALIGMPFAVAGKLTGGLIGSTVGISAAVVGGLGAGMGWIAVGVTGGDKYARKEGAAKAAEIAIPTAILVGALFTPLNAAAKLVESFGKAIIPEGTEPKLYKKFDESYKTHVFPFCMEVGKDATRPAMYEAKTLLGNIHSPKTVQEVPVGEAVITTKKEPLNPLDPTQYGNKAAKLSELDSFLKAEFKGVEVPEFYGLSHQEVQSHLLEHYPNYDQDWKEFVHLKGEGKGLTKEAEEVLNKIQASIENAFTNHVFSSKSTEALLRGYGDSGLVLMVRSTGAEDTAEMANAGGNYSAAGVVMDAQAISVAMGKVVASYHSTLSMTQRSMAGQDITERPITPVLVQLMIGEVEGKSSDEIPVSGIAYTREILGRTDTLTQIQALYGHNEAAVNSLKPLDTFYVYPDGSSHQILRPKEDRLIASEDTFISKPNPKEFIHKACLPEDKLKLLEQVSRKIHEKYGAPMDIEWVYDRAKDKLYIVQVRPLVERFPLEPQTIDFEALRNEATDMKEHSSAMIVSIGAKVVLLKKPEEVLTDTTLDQAFDRFWQLAKEGKHTDIKMVIVKTPSAATSHAACTLREMGVNVCYCETFDPSWLQKKDAFVIVDPQKDLLANGTGFPSDSSHVIQNGWFRHPIAAVETVQTQGPTSKQEAERLGKLIFSGETASEVRNIGTKELRTLLDQLGSDQPEEVASATRELIVWLHFHVQEILESDVNEDLKERGVQLLRNAVKIAERILNSELPQMERLHAGKRLQALVLQQGSVQVINNDSLLQINREKQILSSIQLPSRNLLSEAEQMQLKSLAEGDTILTDEELKTALAIYQITGSAGLSEETKELWNDFSRQIGSSRSGSANRLLLDLLEKNRNAGVLDEWMNLVFPQVFDQFPDNDIGALLKLSENFEKSSSSLEWLQEQKKLIQVFENKEGMWADPQNFDKLFKEFQEFESALKTASVKFQKLPPDDLLSKSAYIKFMKEGIDLYDRSIKSLRGSPNYTDKTLQAEHFKKLLVGYVQISQFWVTKIPDETINSWTRAMNAVEDVGDLRANYKTSSSVQMKGINPDESQLRPSGGFNVAKRVINSCQGDSTKSLENCTLEDLFMLAHQNSLAAFDAVFTPPWEQALPPPLANLNQQVLSILDQSVTLIGTDIQIKANLLSCNVEQKNVVLTYNIPLKFHSATMTVSHEKSTGKTTLSMKMLGHNMNDRMDGIIDNLIFNSIIHGSKLTEIPSYDKTSQQLSASWELSLEDENLGSNILNTVMRSFEDSLTGLWGSSALDLKEMDQGNTNYWEPFYNNPENLKSWLEMRAPYFKEVVRRLENDSQNNSLIQLYSQMGLQLPSSDEPLDLRVLKSIIDLLKTPEQLEGSKKELALISRTLSLNPLFNEEGFKTLLQENGNLFLQNKEYPSALNDLMKNLQRKTFENLIEAHLKAPTENTKASLVRFLDHMKENGQNGFFYDTYVLINEPISRFTGEVYKLLNQQDSEKEALNLYCQEAMKGQEPLEGWRLPKDWVIPGDYLTKEQIKVGDLVLRWNNREWISGRILDINEKGVWIDEKNWDFLPILVGKDEELMVRPTSALKIP